MTEKFLWRPTADWMVLMEIIGVRGNNEFLISWETYIHGKINRPVSGQIIWTQQHYDEAIKLPYSTPLPYVEACFNCSGKRYCLNLNDEIIECNACNGTGIVLKKKDGTKVRYKDSILHPEIELDS